MKKRRKKKKKKKRERESVASSSFLFSFGFFVLAAPTALGDALASAFAFRISPWKRPIPQFDRAKHGEIEG